MTVQQDTVVDVAEKEEAIADYAVFENSDLPTRQHKIVNVKYPNGTDCDVIFTQTIVPVEKEQFENVTREGQLEVCLKLPVETTTFEVAPGVICMQDTPVKMRDGVTIYVDIYLPENAENVPLIVSWSPFGKAVYREFMGNMRLMGVPTGAVSQYAKFESADPLYWCHQGYGIANVDPRGIGNSEGDHDWIGTQDGRDGYDFIEWASAQAWCGKIGMFGNSGVAMSQLRVAAENPPHLACIAPWEATGDVYSQLQMEGGIPGNFMGTVIYGSLRGGGYTDNTVLMAEKEPFLTSPYWQDKIPQYEKIKVPVYLTGCWNHFHIRGAMIAFKKIRSPKKWLRVHREFEWPDTYSPKYREDLKLFFDRYLKDIYNGWEFTPKVRLEILDADKYSYQIDRPESEFPLARTQYKKLYLNAADCSMSDEPSATPTELVYDPDADVVNFEYVFPQDTEITGYMKLRLFAEARGHDDMDVFISIKKASTTGEELPVMVLDTEPHPGAWSRLRASRRHLNEAESTDFLPVYSHDRDEKLEPGQIVAMDFDISPYSRIWHKGQKLRVQIAGHYIRIPWFEQTSFKTDNNGQHVLHTGGQWQSYLLIPEIPPKYADGSYIYR